MICKRLALHHAIGAPSWPVRAVGTPLKQRVMRATETMLVRPTRCVCADGGAGADNRSCQREHQHSIDALHHCPCVREKQGPTLQVKRRLLVFAHFFRSSFDRSLHTARVKAEARPMVPCWRRALDATLWLALIITCFVSDCLCFFLLPDFGTCFCLLAS